MVLQVLHALLFTCFATLRSVGFECMRLLGLLPVSLPATTYRRSINAAVLVTGANSGIGLDLTLQLLSKGYTVFACHRRPEYARQLQNMAAEVRGNLITVLMDVTRPDTIESALATVVQWLDEDRVARCLVAVVNNAGVTDSLPMEVQPDQLVQSVLTTNILGVVRVSKRFLPLLRESRGRLIVVGSMNGRVGVPMLSTYTASKHALEGWCDAVRLELIPQHVQVSLIQPGSIDTPIFGKAEESLNNITSSMSTLQKEVIAQHYARMHTLIPEVLKIVRMRATAPQLVSIQIMHAIESAYPRTRYVVGLDAHLLMPIRRILPDRLWDSAVFAAIACLHFIKTNLGKRSPP